jgi:hypothetical protein
MDLGTTANLIVAITSISAIIIAAVSLFFQIRILVRKDVAAHEKRHTNTENRLKDVESSVQLLNGTLNTKLDSLINDVQFIKDKVF